MNSSDLHGGDTALTTAELKASVRGLKKGNSGERQKETDRGDGYSTLFSESELLYQLRMGKKIAFVVGT